MSNFKNILLRGFHPFYRSLAISVFLLFCYLTLVRFFEYAFLYYNGIIEEKHFWVIIKSFNYDLNATTLWLLGTFPIFLLLGFMSVRLSFKFYRAILLLFLILTIVLNYYFYVNKELLGFNVFSYSFHEIYMIVSHELMALNILFGITTSLIIAIAFYFFIYKAEYNFRFKGDWVVVLIFTIVGIINFSQLKYSSPVSREYLESVEYNLAYNKLDYIVRGGITSKISSTKNESELNLDAVSNYHQLVPADYLTSEFPFLKIRRKTNELGGFFEKKSEVPPNVIFVLCESLSRVFSGPGAKYKGVTPFLDAMVDSSLYWRNFVSNCARTYGVLPNVLGSLPYGNRPRGFQTLQSPYPNHQTLFSMLNKQGYTSEFYYPGWGGFDNVTEFMFVQGVSKNKDRDHFDLDEKPSASWGYSDKQLFNYYLKQLENIQAPFAHALLTLSIHGPYDQAEEKHRKAADEYVKNMPEEKFNQTEKNVIANAMYFDECMEHLLQSIKKSKHYDNTIIVITGDHNVQNLPLRNEIDRFYVPLYIISPLLKKNQNMGGVCSHLDIAPSLTQLFNLTYDVIMPEKVTFVGQGLDTSRAFSATRVFPLNVYSEGLGQFVYKDVLGIESNEYKIGEGLTMKLEDDPTIDMKRLKEDYISLDKYVCNKNKLLK